MKTKPLFELLQQKPHLAMLSTDDAECKALFSRLGILDDFRREATPNTCTLAVDAHPTHWIFACCYSGHAPASENGYSVACLPRVSCSPQEFYEYVKEMREKIGGTDREERLIYRRDDWRTQN